MALTNNQMRFCQEYVKLGMNGAQAYLAVYKNCKSADTARKHASRLMTKEDIQKYISELQDKVEEKAIVSIEDIVNELAIIAFGDRTEIAKVSSEDILDDNNKVIGVKTHLDITDTDKLSNEAKKIISGYKMTQAGISVESCDKVKALELLGKYLGMFKDKVQIENPEATKILSSINSQLSKRK